MHRLRNAITVLSFGLIGLLGTLPAAAEVAETTINIPSGKTFFDFDCGPRKIKPPSSPAPTPPKVDVLVPTKAQLGNLARYVETSPPKLNRKLIAGFDLRDEDGRPRPRRIAFWGDSHIAAGPMMNQLFEAIKRSGTTVGTYFLPPTMGRSNIRLPTLHNYCIGDDWTTELAWKAGGVGEFGPALANRVAEAGTDNRLWLDLRDPDAKPQIAAIRVAYHPTPGGTVLGISVNDGPEKAVRLASGRSGTGILTITSDALIYTLKMRTTAGTFILQGFMLDYDRPPLVTLDVFGLPGSPATGWANTRPDHLIESLGGASYDAVVLEYGTNEGNAPNYNATNYRASLTRTLENMRAAFPNASCIMVGPPDRGVLINAVTRSRPDFLKFARIHREIATIQAELAAAYRCATWDWQAYMGGPGGNYGWAYASPMMMGKDLTHLAPDGYRRTGAALAASIGWGKK